MAKFASNDVLDAALAVVAAADRLVVTSGQPASFSAAVTGALADVAVGPADFALAAGTNGVRRLTVAERAGLVAQAGGTADHVALLDSSGQRLLYVTTCPSQALLAGSALRVAAWQVEIGAPI